MSNAAARKDGEPEPKPTERLDKAGRPLQVNPEWCTRQSDSNHCFSEWFIRCSEGIELRDLHETPSIWKTLQGSPKSLRQYDRVTVVDYAEQWMIEGRVLAASGTIVEIGISKKFDLPPRIVALPQTEDFAVTWGGRGYYVKRKSDGLKVSDMVDSLAVATQFMHDKYKRR